MIELILTTEQARVVAQACEFFARIKMGQFDEIPHLLLANVTGDEFCRRREASEKLLLDARKYIYPDLHGIGHSYGIGKFQDADRAFDVYQVIRYTLGDPRTPFSFSEPLPTCTVTEEKQK